jgi:hypothetical protein
MFVYSSVHQSMRPSLHSLPFLVGPVKGDNTSGGTGGGSLTGALCTGFTLVYIYMYIEFLYTMGYQGETRY